MLAVVAKKPAKRAVISIDSAVHRRLQAISIRTGMKIYVMASEAVKRYIEDLEAKEAS